MICIKVYKVYIVKLRKISEFLFLEGSFSIEKMVLLLIFGLGWIVAILSFILYE